MEEEAGMNNLATNCEEISCPAILEDPQKEKIEVVPAKQEENEDVEVNAEGEIEVGQVNNDNTNMNIHVQATNESHVNESRELDEIRGELPLNEEPNKSEERKNVQLATIEREGWKYIGEVNQKLRDGFGICYYKENKYVGQWKNDMQEGWGKLIYDNGEILQGEIINGVFRGFCQHINPKCLMSSTIGFYEDNKFKDIVIVSNDHKIFEGDCQVEQHDYPESCQKNPKITVGKLYSTKKPDNFFLGEILNYKEEHGYGIFVKKGISLYFGEMKNRIFLNYIEMYSLDGGSFFSFLKNGMKHGLSFSFTKDSRVYFGKYRYDLKVGPFLHCSNSLNLAKSNMRMELYHQGFKSKTTDKLEASKKYLQLYYPEYSDFFNFNYSGIIAYLNTVIFEEIPFVSKMITR